MMKTSFWPHPLPRRNELQVKQITAEELIKWYSDVFDRPLGTLPREVHLEVDNSIKPVTTSTQRVPTALKDDLREELNRSVEKEILAPVEEPTPWVKSLQSLLRGRGPREYALISDYWTRYGKEKPIRYRYWIKFSQNYLKEKSSPHLTCIQVIGNAF